MDLENYMGSSDTLTKLCNAFGMGTSMVKDFCTVDFSHIRQFAYGKEIIIGRCADEMGYTMLYVANPVTYDCTAICGYKKEEDSVHAGMVLQVAEDILAQELYDNGYTVYIEDDNSPRRKFAA